MNMATAVGTTFVARNMIPGTTPIFIAVSTSMFLYMARRNAASATRNRSVAVSWKASHITASRSNPRITRSRGAGARTARRGARRAPPPPSPPTPARRRTPSRLRICATPRDAAAGSARTRSSSTRRRGGERREADESAVTPSARGASESAPSASAPAASAPVPTGRNDASASSTNARVVSNRETKASSRTPDPSGSSPHVARARTPETANRPRTRSASTCPRRHCAATSESARHVFGSPFESLEKTRANDDFSSSRVITGGGAEAHPRLPRRFMPKRRSGRLRRVEGEAIERRREVRAVFLRGGRDGGVDAIPHVGGELVVFSPSSRTRRRARGRGSAAPHGRRARDPRVRRRWRR